MAVSEGEQYIDVRDQSVLEMLDRCRECKREFAVRLHIRHQCGDCVAAYLAKLDRPLWCELWDALRKWWSGAFGRE